MHNALPRLLQRCAEQAGHSCDRERVVPELRDLRPPEGAESTGAAPAGAAGQQARPHAEGREAQLDLVVHEVACPFRWCVDVTVRHAAAERYRGRAANENGHALERATAEKRHRYPDAGGRSVSTLGWETWGRTSPEVHALLEEWARTACGRRRAGSSSRHVAAWLAELDAAVAVWLADSVIEGAGGRAATRWHRQRAGASEHVSVSAAVGGRVMQ